MCIPENRKKKGRRKRTERGKEGRQGSKEEGREGVRKKLFDSIYWEKKRDGKEKEQ